ncbi:hypothetical protein M3Y99_00991200 [Aphelenchoides fujianensis]|nr:hypothetical protein M3Y99_00991200 [Aphelenchoides fujianensis]
MVIYEGEIEEASGALVGQHRMARILKKMIDASRAQDIVKTENRFQTLTIAFPCHFYVVQRHNRRIYVHRLRNQMCSAETFVNSWRNTVQEAEKHLPKKPEAGDAEAGEPPEAEAPADEPKAEAPATSAESKPEEPKEEAEAPTVPTDAEVATKLSDLELTTTPPQPQKEAN